MYLTYLIVSIFRNVPQKKQMESQPLHKVVALMLKDKQLPGSL